MFDGDKKAGGMMRTQIPRFRLPEAVTDEECGYITDMGIELHLGETITSLKDLLKQGFDAIFVGSGAPRGRELEHARAARKPKRTSISASTGCPACLSATRPRSASA